MQLQESYAQTIVYQLIKKIEENILILLNAFLMDPMDSIQRAFTMVLEMAHEEAASTTITMHGFRNINPVQILLKE